MVDYLMNDQKLSTQKKHKEHSCKTKKTKDRMTQKRSNQDSVHIPKNFDSRIKEHKYISSNTSEIDGHNRYLISNDTIVERSQEVS